MFASRICVRNARVTQPVARSSGWTRLQQRHVATEAWTLKELIQTETPLAEQLSATGLWQYKYRPGNTDGKKKEQKKVKGDKHRVNIVDEKLCDDVLDYILPTLDRHAGCDIVDLYPGAGLWSRKLHDAVQPRSHILLEPDAQFYAPFLEPLTSRPNVTLLPKSGIVWAELNEVLSKEHLPHQVVHNPRIETPQRNDTLLVTANLTFYPKRKYQGFANVTQLLLFQFINSIRSGTLFQKYGLVRMLIWVADDDKAALLPRTIQRRKRLSIDVEMSTEYVAEVAGADGKTAENKVAYSYMRDQNIDLESMRDVLDRMEASGTVIPPGRETALVHKLLALPEQERAAIHAGSVPAYYDRAYRVELDQLVAEVGARKRAGKAEIRNRRIKDLEYKINWDLRRSQVIHDMLTDSDMTPAEMAAKIGRMDRYLRHDFMLNRDNLHVFRQDPRVLTWDRRPVEPLVVRPTEFFPNVPSALLDIQPKAAHPLLRQMGPGTNRAGDMFGVILSTLMRNSIEPLGTVLEGIYPGASQGVLGQCPTLGDRSKLPLGYTDWDARALNESQLVEILEAWLEWPFRPDFSELVARETEDSEHVVDDDNGAVQLGDF